jgi:ribosomal protein S18 acetylase RimI-like enzyme
MSKYSPRITRSKHKQLKLASGDPLTLDNNEEALHRYAPSVDETERLVEKQQAQEAAKTVQRALLETRQTLSEKISAIDSELANNSSKIIITTTTSSATTTNSQSTGLHFYTCAELSNEIVEDLLTLTRNNMKHLYDAAKDWAWNDTRKRGEFRDDRMRFLLLRRKAEKKNINVEMNESGISNVVGFAAFRFSCEMSVPHVYVHEIQLLDSCRGKGYGKLLMQTIEEIGIAVEMQLVLLTCLNNNRNAVDFYTSLGYSVDEASPGPCFNLGQNSSMNPDVFPYQILSKVLNPIVYKYKCELCTNSPPFQCRFDDSLEQHRSYVHGVPWKFPCPYCPGGTVFAHQLQRHVEILHQSSSNGSGFNGTSSNNNNNNNFSSSTTSNNSGMSLSTLASSSSSSSNYLSLPVTTTATTTTTALSLLQNNNNNTIKTAPTLNGNGNGNYIHTSMDNNDNDDNDDNDDEDDEMSTSTSAAAAAATGEMSSPSNSTTTTNNNNNKHDYTFERVTLKSDGSRGTVIKSNDRGFYTVRLDGEGNHLIQCRPSAFEGHVTKKVIKRVIDPDWEFAMRLQMEDGWARKSSRFKDGS